MQRIKNYIVRNIINLSLHILFRIIFNITASIPNTNFELFDIIFPSSTMDLKSIR